MSVPIQQLIPKGSRVTVFQSIFWVFLVLGTAVGVVVIGYMLWNAYKYRDRPGREDEDGDYLEMGEIPTGGGKGRKLFLSFGLSAVIVISLIVWTYGTLLFVEGQNTGQAGSGVDVENQDPVVVDVEGYQFGWRYEYENGMETQELVVPEDRVVQLNVTSADVWHNFGIPAFRVKTDAIPGQTTRTWFVARETGNYTAKCYELCGAGHSYMESDVRVLSDSEFESWYENGTEEANATAGADASATRALAPAVAP